MSTSSLACLHFMGRSHGVDVDIDDWPPFANAKAKANEPRAYAYRPHSAVRVRVRKLTDISAPSAAFPQVRSRS